MKGGIYSKAKCPVCGGRVVVDILKEAFACPLHPKVLVCSKIFVKFPPDINVRFGDDFQAAIQFLYGLRHEKSNGKFDEREYHKENPLIFERYAERYLQEKKRKRLRSMSEVERIIGQAAQHFRGKSVRNITRADLTDYLFGLTDKNGNPVGDKTRYNHMAQLRNFFNFVKREEKPRIFEPPDMPDIEFELGWRNTVGIEEQSAVLQTIYDNTRNNPKIYLAIALLCDHSEIRPGDILRIKEGDISIRGEIHIKQPTKKKNRFHSVYLWPSDELRDEIVRFKKKYPAMPDIPFFRHHPKHSKVKPDTPFGVKLLYKVAKKAMAEHGIHDVDLYAFTKHSTVTAISDAYGEEAGREATGHKTNAAFARYYVKRRGHQQRTGEILNNLRGKVIPFGEAKND